MSKYSIKKVNCRIIVERKVARWSVLILTISTHSSIFTYRVSNKIGLQNVKIKFVTLGKYFVLVCTPHRLFVYLFCLSRRGKLLILTFQFSVSIKLLKPTYNGLKKGLSNTLGQNNGKVVVPYKIFTRV